MTKPVAALLIALGLASAAACGRKGPLVLPQGRAPLPVAGLTVVAGEGQVALRWTNPTKEISGRPLGALGAIEIWVFDQGLPEGGEGTRASDMIEKTARLVRRIPEREIAAYRPAEGEAPGTMTFAYAVPPGAASPAKLAFAVRVFDRRGRASEFAGPVALDISRKVGGVDPAPGQGVS
jgi:hypothetical protein